MRILITNDDGIQASQLVPLVKWARKLGEVVVAAPKVEQSGKSHGIEIHKPFEVKQLELLPGVRAYAVDSTPADCIRFAILGLHETFDLVISGVNRGLNIGRDIMYSGTVSAVMEAANLGVQAVAISTDPAVYECAVERLDEVLAFFREHQLLKLHDIYNVNIPVQVRGFRITRQGGPYYSDDFIPQENNIVLPRGTDVFEPSGSMDSDTDAVLLGGYISVTPLTLERTDMPVYEKLKALEK